MLKSVYSSKNIARVTFKMLDNFDIVVGWSVRPQKNHLIWAIVLPIRELFMYIESTTDLSSRGGTEARNIHTKRTGNSYGRAGQERDSGWVAAVRIYGQALRIQIVFTDVFRLVHSICLCSYYLLCLLRLCAGLTLSP